MMNNEPAARTVKPAALPRSGTAFTLIEPLGVIATVAILILLGHLPAGQAFAATIYADTNDCEVQWTLSSPPLVIADLASSVLIVGTAGTTGKERCPVIPFQLPDFGAVTNPFSSASFSCNIASYVNTPIGNADLYGLGRRADATVLTNDYWAGTSAVDSTDATFLQDNLLLTPPATGIVTNSVAGRAALVNYLNAQYAGGAGAGQFVFLRLSTDTAQTGVHRWQITSAEGAAANLPAWPQINYTLAPPDYSRPFIWVRNVEKAGILAKIATNAWATNVFNGMVSRVAADVASHQTNRDAWLRQLPVDWTLSPARFKTIPTYSESTVRYPAEAKFNDALDCAVLYYLTGDAQYARCAADVLHNAVKTLLPVAPSTSVGNGGWIFQDDFLKEARVTGTQLGIVYDFLYTYLQTNPVYDVQTGGMVPFNFTDAQSVFRTLYQLARDHGQKDSNWSALMATCMLNSLLALDDPAERAAALQVYLITGSSRQASLDYDYRYYNQPGDIWPESLQYASAVGSIRSTHMVLLERVDPALNLFNQYPNLPLSLPRISYLRYPNGEQICFGDGHRASSGQPFFRYELVYQHAAARGRGDLTSYFGSLISSGVAAGEYNRSTLKAYESLGQHDEPLQLLWLAPTIPEPPVPPVLPRADTLPFAGIALQRNPASVSNSTYGLMGFVGGAAHVHSHASGMSMELFGPGQVLGAKAGHDDYGSAIHEKFYRLFAANNTIIVNAASRGQGGWSDIAINTVQTVAMEPQPFAPAVSSNFSFTCSSFADDKGTLAEATQQRTLAIVRTSPTTGFYVDLFRSKSTVTNRVAVTLNGNVTNQFHDYIYRNIGETTVDLRTNGAVLPLFSQPDRFQNDIGDAYAQPGWRYFTNTMVSHPHSQPVWARFTATPTGKPTICMDMHLPAVASREVAKVDSPPIVEAPAPYSNKRSPTLVIRQIGEAWNKPFAAVYEPHFGSAAATVTNVTALLRGNVVVGVKIESFVAGRNRIHYVLSNPGASETYTDNSIGLSFQGRFGVVADHGDYSTTLYLGEGSSLSYRGNSVAIVSGTNSAAEVQFTPGQRPIITANAPVNAVAASAPQFTLIARQADGGVAFLAVGSPGVPYRFWATTNLTSGPWTLLSTGTVTNSPFLIQDAGAAAIPKRFYRFSTP
jgi:hypothetical protein